MLEFQRIQEIILCAIDIYTIDLIWIISMENCYEKCLFSCANNNLQNL